VSRTKEQGVALVLVMMTITLLAALVGSLTLATITETSVAVHFRDAADARYAAEAAVELALQEIAGVDDWSDLLAGGRSAFVDGPPGVRPVGAEGIDLDRAAVELTGAAVPPPGAVHLPSVLHASGWFRDMVPGVPADSGLYVAVWVADRSAASKAPDSPPATLSVVGASFGGRGARRIVEALVERADTSAVRLVAWRELP
jgi:hypothetical protein